LPIGFPGPVRRAGCGAPVCPRRRERRSRAVVPASPRCRESTRRHQPLDSRLNGSDTQESGQQNLQSRHPAP
jgi:hypothetical protein